MGTLRRLTIALVLVLAVAPVALGQSLYRSVASGNWGTLATWERSTDGGVTWATPLATTDTLSDVTVRNGHTVAVEASGKYCRNLMVEAGGILYANAKLPSSGIRYVRVKGPTVTVNGTWGDPTSRTDSADVLSFDAMGPTATIQGSGTINIARLRPYASRKNVEIIIDANVAITYAGTSGTGGSGIYTDNAGGDSITLTVNAGRTVTMANFSNFATSSSSAGDGTATTVFNINGTLNVPNGNLGLGVGAGKSCTLNIAGTLNAGRNVYTTGSTGVTSTINVTGTFNTGINGSTSVYLDNPSQVISGSGTFTLGPLATLRIGAPGGLDPTTGAIRTAIVTLSPLANYSYLGTSAQYTGTLLPLRVRGLTINNTSSVTLSHSLLVDTTLTLTNGALLTGVDTLAVGPGGGVARTSGYVDGNFAKVGFTGATTFEVGTVDGYSPVVVNPTAGIGAFMVSAINGSHPNLANGALALRRYWKLASLGITAADLTFSYPAGDVQGTETGYMAGRRTTGSQWSTFPATIDAVGHSAVVTGVTVFSDWTLGELGAFKAFDDPSSLAVTNALGTITLDGKLDEAEWATAPALAYGNGAFLKKGVGEKTVTGEYDAKATYEYRVDTTSYGIFHRPNTDSSLAKVKFLRKGANLFIGIQSNDKSICKFDWEGEGMFLKIKKANGTDLEYKLYYQNIGTAADTIRYEGPGGLVNYGAGAGFLPVGSTVNDTTNVDNGYSAELMIRLDSLGYTSSLGSVQLTLVVFDPDGYQHPTGPAMNLWDTTAGSYYKSWWGSEWGGVYRSLLFTPEPVKFEDPPSLAVKNVLGAVILDGKLDEAEWATAPALAYGNGAFLKKGVGEKTVTGEYDAKATYEYRVDTTSYGIFHRPNTDSSLAKVKFLRKGANLFIGIQSNDKSICKFDWEGEGMFLKIKKANGTDLEYKLYYQNIGTAADTIRYEGPGGLVNYGAGAGFLPVGSTVNDTTNVDNGYSAELMIRLDSLGYTSSLDSVKLTLVVFDPDGYQHPTGPAMNLWDTTAGSYYKSWWGSEWGGVYRSLLFTPEPVKFEDPPSLAVKNVLGAVILDGKLDEAEWATAPALAYGNGAFLKKGVGEKTVTGEYDAKATYEYRVDTTSYGIFHRPNTDSSLAKVKFLRKGANLFIGIQSNDKSICKFDWEGEGMFLKIKKANGTDLEYKLYYQNIGTAADTIRYEGPGGLVNYGAGAGFLPVGSTVNDTTNVDNGYSAELMIRLDSLGYTSSLGSVQLTLVVFDPDGYQHPTGPAMNLWDTTAGSYYKSWWGSEWGGVYRSLLFTPEPVKFEDPDTLFALTATTPIVVDGQLTEPDWATAPTLAYGNGAFLKKGVGEKTVTGEYDAKATYEYRVDTTSYGIFHRPNTDSSLAKVKFLRKGANLFIGIQSNDKSICKFDWEGEGMFLKIKKANGTDLEYKLYYQNIGTAADTIRYEGPGGLVNYGAGAGFLPVGSTVNDTTNVDNGYSAELMIRLDSLGYAPTAKAVQLSLVVFDPDGYQHPTGPAMNLWDTTAGSYYKSWWGSEWGGVYRVVAFDNLVGVPSEESNVIPTVYALYQNFPNPFNPSTRIRFDLPSAGNVRITVFDLTGREVATVVQGDYVAGRYTTTFDASRLASGVYFYRIIAVGTGGSAPFISTNKLVLIK